MKRAKTLKSKSIKRKPKLKTTHQIINEALINTGAKALFDTTNFKIGSPLRIKLPTDYQVKTEAVNHPAHYGGKDNPYETIKVLEARLTREEFIGAMKFQVYKYNDRALMKGDELENYEKGAFYQNYLVAYVKKN